MRRFIAAILLVLLFLPKILLSQDTFPTVRLKFDTRFDFTGKIPTHDSLSTLSSFDGKPGYQSFCNATNWLYLNFKTTDDRHTIGFQITNSPFSTQTLQSICSYNLIWYGNFNGFYSIYSLNRIEYEKDRYITLGNKFSISNLKYPVNNRIKLLVKTGYDENKAQEPTALFIYDRYVEPGTEHFFYGAGVEYFPISNSKDVRIHAVWASNNDLFQYHTFNVGVRWQMNVLKK